MQACHYVVLQCFIIGHFRSRDLESKVKKLVIIAKTYKTKPKQLVTLNFQGKHVTMCFKSSDLGRVIWGQRSKNLSSLQQLITTKSRKLEFSNFQCNCVTSWHYPDGCLGP